MKIDLSKYEIDYLTMILEQKIEDYEDNNSNPYLLYQHNAIQDLYSKLIILTKLEKDAFSPNVNVDLLTRNVVREMDWISDDEKVKRNPNKFRKQ